jgi:hypothetical protein
MARNDEAANSGAVERESAEGPSPRKYFMMIGGRGASKHLSTIELCCRWQDPSRDFGETWIANF